MTSTSDEAFRKHIASFDNMAVAIEWKRRYEAHDSLVKALECARSQCVTLGGDPRTLIAENGSIEGDEIQAAVLDEIDAALSQAKGGK